MPAPKLGSVAKIAIGWTILIAGGLGTFVWAKRSVYQQRHEVMRARQRMLRANEVDYESERKFTG